MVWQRSSSTAMFARAILAANDAVDDLDAADRADAARRALAAGFDRAEFHREARLLRHVDGVVEHDDAAMADQAVARRERLVVERRVEQRAGEIGAERAADLHRAHRPPARRAAADIVDQFAQRDAERGLEQPAMLDVAGELDRHGAARAAHAEIAIERGAFGQDHRHRGERQHVVDDGRPAEQPLMRRQRRLRAHIAALAFEAFEQRGLLAADIGAGADAHLDVEGKRRIRRCAAPSSAASARGVDRRVHRGDGMGIFRADVDVALGRADRDAGDRHAFDQHERIAFHDHAVGEGAAVAFVGIADDVFLRRLRLRDRAPLDAGRKAGAAASAQARLHHLFDDASRVRASARAPGRDSRHGRDNRRARADRRCRSARRSAASAA